MLGRCCAAGTVRREYSWVTCHGGSALPDLWKQRSCNLRSVSVESSAAADDERCTDLRADPTKSCGVSYFVDAHRTTPQISVRGIGGQQLEFDDATRQPWVALDIAHTPWLRSAIGFRPQLVRNKTVAQHMQSALKSDPSIPWREAGVGVLLHCHWPYSFGHYLMDCMFPVFQLLLLWGQQLSNFLPIVLATHPLQQGLEGRAELWSAMTTQAPQMHSAVRRLHLDSLLVGIGPFWRGAANALGASLGLYREHLMAMLNVGAVVGPEVG